MVTRASFHPNPDFNRTLRTERLVKGWFILIFGIVLVTVIGIPVVGMATKFSVSTGFRDGRLQKLTHKGILFTTHEGELALETLGTSWEFSVTDPRLVTELEALPPETHIRLHYTQPLWVKPWEGKSGYLVNRLEVAGARVELQGK